MESQKVAEDGKNRKKINDCCGPIVLQTQLAIFPALERNKSFMILID